MLVKHWGRNGERIQVLLLANLLLHLYKEASKTKEKTSESKQSVSNLNLGFFSIHFSRYLPVAECGMLFEKVSCTDEKNPRFPLSSRLTQQLQN